MKARIITIAALSLMLATATAAMGFEPMTAVVRVSNGPLYDYIVIGENPNATDGYDNSYDTISPGNLNEAMGEAFISSVVVHPEFKAAMRELRGDIRKPVKRQEWRITLSSSLSAGTLMMVQLDRTQSKIPDRVKLLVKDLKSGNEIDLKKEPFLFPAPGNGKKSVITIYAEQ